MEHLPKETAFQSAGGGKQKAERTRSEQKLDAGSWKRIDGAAHRGGGRRRDVVARLAANACAPISDHVGMQPVMAIGLEPQAVPEGRCLRELIFGRALDEAQELAVSFGELP